MTACRVLGKLRARDSAAKARESTWSNDGVGLSRALSNIIARTSRSQSSESFLNHVESVFCEVESVEFCAGEPPDFVCVAGGEELAPRGAAEEIDQDIVILHAAFGIAKDAIINAEEFAGFDEQSSFFASFTNGGFADHFSDFEHAAGNGPMSLDGGMGTLHENNVFAFDDDGADADQREFGKFAFHFSFEL